MNETMMVRRINSKVEINRESTFYKCNTFKDICTFVKVYMDGFGINKYKYLLYILNNINAKYENYIVYQEGKIIGCFALYSNEDTLCLYDFTILKKYRGIGLGSDCLNQIINLVYDKGFNELYLFVRKGNDTAISLYIKHNFYFC